MSVQEQWVLDASVSHNGALCFCPMEPDGNVIFGLSFISDEPPGEFVGIVHPDGLQAIEDWQKAHPNVAKEMFELYERQHPKESA